MTHTAPNRWLETPGTSPLRVVLGWACILVFAVGFAATVAAQTAGKLAVGGVTTDGTTLSASVTVSDGSGRPVAGLKAESFTVQVDGQPISDAIVDANAGTVLPLGLVLVMDISNTMSTASIAGAKEAFSQIIRSLRPADEATLVTISTNITQVVKPTSDHEALLAGVHGVSPGGRTALYAAVVQSVGYAKAAPQPQKVVVLVTEGGGRVGEEFGGASGNVSRTMALEAASSGGAPLYVVGIGKEADVTFLTALATNSGGLYISASSGSEVSQLYTRLSDRLHLQYNVSVSLPEGLTAGSHTVSVTANGATGQGSFTTTVAVPAAAVAPPPSFAGIEAVLTARSTAKVSNLPIGSSVTFTLDGQPLAANSGDKRSVALDPAKLDPARPHTLQARFDALDPAKLIEATFNVAMLAPKIIDPAGVITLRPGDLVKVIVQSQPGVVPTVRYFVDGNELEVDSAAPYEFTLAKDGFAPGGHKLALVAEANGLKSEQVFEFAGPKAPAQASNALKYALLALLALALVGGAGHGGWTFLGRARERRGALVVTDAPERLIRWADTHRFERPKAELPPEPKRGAGDAWGMLEITQGAGVGTKFLLYGSRVMVGRGKFCTVKLNDKEIEETHFLMTSAGEIFASTPSCSLTVNGEDTRDGALTDGAVVGVGGTVLRFKTIASAEHRQAS